MLRRLRHVGRLLGELAALARVNRVWWPLALVALLLVLSVVVVVAQTAAPYIYTIF